jgi:hypothetical protein
MEKDNSPAAIAGRIAQRQADLAANVSQLKAELRPTSLASRARHSIRAEVRRLTRDDSGRLTTPVLAVLAGSAALVLGAIVLRLVRR